MEYSEGEGYCFACGRNNPVGLHLQFKEEDSAYVSDFVLAREYQSYDGIVHGGIVSTVLDEIMGGYLYYQGYSAVTARLELRYREPTPTEVPLRVKGWIVRQRGSFVDMKAQLLLADGTVTAEATSRIAILGRR